MSEQFYIHGRGNEPCVNWTNGGVVAFYESLINLIRRNPGRPFGREISEFLSHKLLSCGGGFSSFDVDLVSEDAKPIEFWKSMAELIAQLAESELAKGQPLDDLALIISWEDEIRCKWRIFLEEIYALINEALPISEKLRPLRPWSYESLKGPDPKTNLFQCQRCCAIIKAGAEKCPDCGWTWQRKGEW